MSGLFSMMLKGVCPWVRASSLFGATFVLTGCVSLRGTMDPKPILPAPDVPIEVSQFGSTISEICALSTTTKTGPTDMQSIFVRDAYCAQRYVESNGNANSKHLTRFVSTGISLADRYCSDLITALETRRREATYAQTSVNIVGAGATALLAVIPGAHSRSILNLATGLTASNAMFENYKANYILTPDIEEIHIHIKGLRNEKADQMIARVNGGTYKGYGEAYADLVQYEGLCSAASMRKIINESIKAAKFLFGDEGTQELRDLKAGTLLKEVSAAAGVSPPGAVMSTAEFRWLFIAVRNRNAPNLIKPIVDGVGLKNGNESNSKSEMTAVSGYLKNLKYSSTASAPNYGLDPNVIKKIEQINDLQGWDSDAVTSIAFRSLIEELGQKSALPKPAIASAGSVSSYEALRQSGISNMSPAARSGGSGRLNFNYKAVSAR